MSSIWQHSGYGLQESALRSRALGYVLAAQPVRQLHELLTTILHGLLEGEARVEIYARDGSLRDPAVQHDALSCADDGCSSLAYRLRVRPQELTSARAFPALRHPERTPLMSAPLLDGEGELAGVIVVESSPGRPDFTAAQLAVLEGIAQLLSVALHRPPSSELEPVRSVRMVDRERARRLQRRLMSGGLPPGIGVSALVAYQPAFDVGGDFYALEHVGAGCVAVAIGDVSGNGVSAALIMSRVVSEVERRLRSGETPSVVLDAIDETVAVIESELFVTASCLRLDTSSRMLTVANAGHLPMIVRRANGEVFACAGASGAPLGMAAGVHVEEQLRLEPRDIVLLMTDGLLEALDHPTGQMGMDRLMRLVQQAPHDPPNIDERLRASVDGARRRHPVDDVTWVQLQLSA